MVAVAAATIPESLKIKAAIAPIAAPVKPFMIIWCFLYTSLKMPTGR